MMRIYIYIYIYKYICIYIYIYIYGTESGHPLLHDEAHSVSFPFECVHGRDESALVKVMVTLWL
jgi:hypothetical protein